MGTSVVGTMVVGEGTSVVGASEDVEVEASIEQIHVTILISTLTIIDKPGSTAA